MSVLVTYYICYSEGKNSPHGNYTKLNYTAELRSWVHQVSGSDNLKTGSVTEKRTKGTARQMNIINFCYNLKNSVKVIYMLKGKPYNLKGK